LKEAVEIKIRFGQKTLDRKGKISEKRIMLCAFHPSPTICGGDGKLKIAKN
jgi:hypothetical protein